MGTSFACSSCSVHWTAQRSRYKRCPHCAAEGTVDTEAAWPLSTEYSSTLRELAVRAVARKNRLERHWAMHPNCEKRWEHAWVERMAREASECYD